MKPFLIAMFMILWLGLGPANKANAQIVYGYSLPLDDGGIDSSGSLRAALTSRRCTTRPQLGFARGFNSPPPPSLGEDDDYQCDLLRPLLESCFLSERPRQSEY